MNKFIQAIRKSADLKGRSTRSDFWLFSIYCLIFFVVIFLLDNLVDRIIPFHPYGSYFIVYLFAMIVPAVSVAVRRLHDVGKPGSTLLLLCIPLFGPLIILVLLSINSHRSLNQYGHNPNSFV